MRENPSDFEFVLRQRSRVSAKVNSEQIWTPDADWRKDQVREWLDQKRVPFLLP